MDLAFTSNFHWMRRKSVWRRHLRTLSGRHRTKGDGTAEKERRIFFRYTNETSPSLSGLIFLKSEILISEQGSRKTKKTTNDS